MSAVDGPDFICVGMPKAGTGWLYDQLQTHPDFWMPPVKEVLYLHREFPVIPLSGDRGGYGLKQLERHGRKNKPEKKYKPHQQPRDPERDRGFRDAAREANGKAMDLDRYISLFRFKGEQLSGDISPMYTELDSAVIAQLVERLPTTKLIMIAREPIARVWSRLCMLNRGSKLDTEMLGDSKRFREFLETSPIIQGKSFPTKIVEHWRKYAPNMQLRTFLFDGVAQDPESTRRDIWTYLGADPSRQSSLPANYNRKSGNRKIEMSTQVKEVLVDFFADEIRACGEMFGGRARDWATRYGL